MIQAICWETSVWILSSYYRESRDVYLPYWNSHSYTHTIVSAVYEIGWSESFITIDSKCRIFERRSSIILPSKTWQAGGSFSVPTAVLVVQWHWTYLSLRRSVVNVVDKPNITAERFQKLRYTHPSKFHDARRPSLALADNSTFHTSI